MRPRTSRPRRRRRVWREGGRSWGRQAATHAPDPEPDKSCHRSAEPAGRGCSGRSGPEPRSRLTCDKSPVRESRTPGSVGEVPGNRHLYPTIYSHGAAKFAGFFRIKCLFCPCRGLESSRAKDPRRINCFRLEFRNGLDGQQWRPAKALSRKVRTLARTENLEQLFRLEA